MNQDLNMISENQEDDEEGDESSELSTPETKTNRNNI